MDEISQEYLGLISDVVLDGCIIDFEIVKEEETE